MRLFLSLAAFGAVLAALDSSTVVGASPPATIKESAAKKTVSAFADFGGAILPKVAALIGRGGGGSNVFPQSNDKKQTSFKSDDDLSFLLTPRFLKVEMDVLTPEQCAKILSDSPKDKDFVTTGSVSRTTMPVVRDLFNLFVAKFGSAAGAAGANQQDNHPTLSLPISRVDQTTVPHQDHYADPRDSDPERLGRVVNEPVVLLYLNDNPEAVFVYGDERIQAKCGTKISFNGAYVHYTEHTGGQPVKFLGPATGPQAYVAGGEPCCGPGTGCSGCSNCDGDDAVDACLTVHCLAFPTDGFCCGQYCSCSSNILMKIPEPQKTELLARCETCNTVPPWSTPPTYCFGGVIPEPDFDTCVVGGGCTFGGGAGAGGGGCFSEDSSVRMADGTLKRIADIQIGDKVAKGGRVTSLMTFANNKKNEGSVSQGLCRIDETLVATSGHMMIDPAAAAESFEEEGFSPAHKLVESSSEGPLCQEYVELMYDMDTENHVIEFEHGIVATDYNEHEIVPEFAKIEKEMALDTAKVVLAAEHQDPDDSLFLYNVDFAGESMVKMEDGSFKAIDAIELNDVVALGGRVTGVFQIDGSDEQRLCRVAPHVVVCEEYLVYYLHEAAFAEADYDMSCEEAPEIIMYHLDTEEHLLELQDNVFTVDYSEHAPLAEFTAKEMKMTKDLVGIAKAM